MQRAGQTRNAHASPPARCSTLPSVSGGLREEERVKRRRSPPPISSTRRRGHGGTHWQSHRRGHSLQPPAPNSADNPLRLWHVCRFGLTLGWLFGVGPAQALVLACKKKCSRRALIGRQYGFSPVKDTVHEPTYLRSQQFRCDSSPRRKSIFFCDPRPGT